ncbi:hypothetical protein CQW23_31259 [Capsicum baccatum]|uniref:Uncharacterized protein n=1 Tax=Capsicum baccatum TaxID=33114 RepID=A0A2G2V824_CAPBA|nr:hypothetical protein CQW23_31259 [Capsicum baccatum]
MDLSQSPHGHSKKVHPKKSGLDSSRRDLSIQVFIRTIRRLTKEKVQMDSEVSSMLQNQVAERASAKEESSILQAELDSRTRRLETEKNDLQSIVEKELDRKSSDWSLRLKKYQIEQHRLRVRARELAYLSKRIEQVSEESQNLRQQLTQLQEKYRVAQDNRDYVRDNYQEKVEELKSETLLTTMLREKLYSEEMDIKQLQADLAATVRGNDILKCEVQNMLDSLSCATHKLKYLELQVLKKDENINQLTNDLQECMKELGVVKGILPKVFQERDFMWEEVKSYAKVYDGGPVESQGSASSRADPVDLIEKRGVTTENWVYGDTGKTIEVDEETFAIDVLRWLTNCFIISRGHSSIATAFATVS